MTDPKQLTEEAPESPKDLSARGLVLSAGQIEAGKVLTEDLPQEEDERPGPSLLTED